MNWTCRQTTSMVTIATHLLPAGQLGLSGLHITWWWKADQVWRAAHHGNKCLSSHECTRGPGAQPSPKTCNLAPKRPLTKPDRVCLGWGLVVLIKCHHAASATNDVRRGDTSERRQIASHYTSANFSTWLHWGFPLNLPDLLRRGFYTELGDGGGRVGAELLDRS
jgi:hypothetical protein